MRGGGRPTMVAVSDAQYWGAWPPSVDPDATALLVGAGGKQWPGGLMPGHHRHGKFEPESLRVTAAVWRRAARVTGRSSGGELADTGCVAAVHAVGLRDLEYGLQPRHSALYGPSHPRMSCCWGFSAASSLMRFMFGMT
jgi:hypothetical protein